MQNGTDMGSTGIIGGRGRGRGRARPVGTYSVNLDNLEFLGLGSERRSISTISSAGSSMSEASHGTDGTGGEWGYSRFAKGRGDVDVGGLKAADVGRFEDLEEDEVDNAQTTWDDASVSSSASSMISQASAALPLVKVQIGFGVDVPSRLLFEQGKVLFKLLTMDLEQHLAYITFVDEITLNLRDDLKEEMKKVYQSDKRLGLAVPLKELDMNNVYVVKDDNGKFHRGMVVKQHASSKHVRIVDVDTYEQFVVTNLEIFRMTDEVAHYFFQVMACKFGFSKGMLTNHWVKENHFAFKNMSLMEQALMSMAEVHVGNTLLAGSVQKETVDGKDIIRVGFNIMESLRMKHNFLHALMFYTVPRLPGVGTNKIAIITNIKETGHIDIVFVDQMYFELLEILNFIQISNKFFAPRCRSMTRYLRNIICCYTCKRFLAPVSGDWNELQRARIIGVQQDKDEKSVKLQFLDSGKLSCLPLSDLSNLAIPISAKHMPELLELIPPQSITFRVNNIEEKDIPQLLAMKSVLEGSICYVKNMAEAEATESADDSSSNSTAKYPLVEIITRFKGKVLPLVEIVRFDVKEEANAERKPEDIKKEEERKLKLEEELKDYDAFPLERFEKKLEVALKKGRAQLEAARSQTKAGACLCACCTLADTPLEDKFSGLELNVYKTLGK